MHIYIPTLGRADNIVTLRQFRSDVRKNTTLVVQAKDYDENERLYKTYGCGEIYVLPTKIRTIAPTRQHIIELANARNQREIVMMDDDLRFSRRREDDPTKFEGASAEDVLVGLAVLKKQLSYFAHVSFMPREGANRHSSDLKCTRMMRVLGYNPQVLAREGIRFDRLPLQEDFDVTLQLLRKGYENLVLCGLVHDQGSSNAKGGCSTFRTIAMHNKNAQELAQLHKPFVKVVEKQTKGAWNGQPRLDVTVQWKKAYQSSKEKYNAR